VELLIS